MGKYCTLIAGKDFLEQESEIVATRARFAERQADAFIDGYLTDWDKSAWTPDSVPEEVRIIALQRASAHYFLMMVASGAPTEDLPPLPKLLMEHSKAGVDCIISRGFICGTGTSRIGPISAGAQSLRCTR